MAKGSCIVGDIGGTNARFALASGSGDRVRIESVTELRCADFASANAAIRHFIERSSAPAPRAICLAAAGPVVAESVRFTNNEWVIQASELREAFAIDDVSLINDFEAVAWAVPLFGPDDLQIVGDVEPAELPADGCVAVVGPGTGLGAVALRIRDGQRVPVPGEGGHIAFAPATEVQDQLLQALRRRFERVSVERLLSGPGVENIYWALSQLRGGSRPSLTAAGIFDGARDDELAAEAVQLFFEILGQVAGDLALVLGATGGLYVGGGIVRRYPQQLAASRFRTAFEDKGRHAPILQKTPTALILDAQPGLRGAGYLAVNGSP